MHVGLVNDPAIIGQYRDVSRHLAGADAASNVVPRMAGPATTESSSGNDVAVKNYSGAS